ncbi:hypothetical protein Z950_194 [Sulfitobacter mediterraneus KCTC 32188]|nr:hypothetical protein Z950_194 [Sulfitobacter mediterraneus KCTC 32188]
MAEAKPVIDRIIIVPFAAPSLRLQYGETAARGKPRSPPALTSV